MLNNHTSKISANDFELLYIENDMYNVSDVSDEQKCSDICDAGRGFKCRYFKFQYDSWDTTTWARKGGTCYLFPSAPRTLEDVKGRLFCTSL